MDFLSMKDFDSMRKENPLTRWGDMQKSRQANEKFLMEQQQAQANLQSTNLANMFAEQNNPIRVQQAQAALESTGYANREAAVNAKNKEANAPFELDAKQKEFIRDAKKADLDSLEYFGQQLAYSPDPQKRAQGEEMLRQHKTFIQLRDTQKFQASQADKRYIEQKNLANLNHSNAVSLENIRSQNKVEQKKQSSNKIGSVFESVKSGKVSPDKAAAAFGAAYLQALQAGNIEEASQYQQAAQMMEQLATTVKPDTQVGKPDLGGMGIQTTPPRPPTFGNQGGPAPQQQAPTIADVQKMYPGVPADKLRQAYKNKFGVDLQ